MNSFSTHQMLAYSLDDWMTMKNNRCSLKRVIVTFTFTCVMEHAYHLNWWWFSLVVTLSGTLAKLLYVEAG